ncbi:hypothetical protein [Pseudomonas mandelii]|uniref:Uncharacterized protein n=1 Tax=Pseudomonas mandelii TaxID=75612 RepID=A0ABY0VVP0_9PSED|nr:hypothetical protein [Pseudomonas mandelii]TWS07966.1 hypothetical protein FJD35_23955 [Pseudomonas mandelii]SDU58410.1 hypothetical protein SAMN04489801_4722 [Pseudomonas mandelii]
MTLTCYRYTGPQSAATLRVGDTGELDVQLLPGKPVELPASHDYTLVLLTLKHLTPLPPYTKPAAVPHKPEKV